MVHAWLSRPTPTPAMRLRTVIQALRVPPKSRRQNRQRSFHGAARPPFNSAIGDTPPERSVEDLGTSAALGATSGKVEKPILQRCVYADFAARPRAEKPALANEACHRAHCCALTDWLYSTRGIWRRSRTSLWARSSELESIEALLSGRMDRGSDRIAGTVEHQEHHDPVPALNGAVSPTSCERCPRCSRRRQQSGESHLDPPRFGSD